MKKNKIIVAVLAILAVLVVLIAMRSCGNQEADAAGYVQANLDLVFQGEIQGASEFVDASSDELEQMYENGIQAFAAGYLMGDLDSEGLYTSTFEMLIKEIFAIMRYQVGEAKEVENGVYEVPVTYQTADVFTKLIPQIQEESMKIQQAMNSGGYEGTEEEQLMSALRDYLLFAHEALEMAYLEIEYGEKDTFTFVVKETENGSLEVQDNGINTFIERILELDKL